MTSEIGGVGPWVDYKKGLCKSEQERGAIGGAGPLIRGTSKRKKKGSGGEPSKAGAIRTREKDLRSSRNTTANFWVFCMGGKEKKPAERGNEKSRYERVFPVH